MSNHGLKLRSRSDILFNTQNSDAKVSDDFLGLNKRVLCKYGGNFYYEAKIVGVSQDENGDLSYTIHYRRWSKTFDEILSRDAALKRCKKWTSEDASIAKEEIDIASGKDVSRASSVVRKSLPVAKPQVANPVEKRMVSTRSRSNVLVEKTAATCNQPPEVGAPVTLTEEQMPYKHFYHYIYLLDQDFTISRSCLKLEIQIPPKLIKLASEHRVFPVKRSIEDVFQKYREEIPFRRPYTYGRRQNVYLLIDGFEEQLKHSLQFYLFPFEMNEYFKNLNEKRLKAQLPSVEKADYMTSAEYHRTEAVSSTPVNAFLKASISDVLLPMNDMFDQVAIIRYIYSFKHFVARHLPLHIFYLPLFNDMLAYMEATTPYELYEMI